MQLNIPLQKAITQMSTPTRKVTIMWTRRLIPFMTLGTVLVLWQMMTTLELVPPFLIPPPAAVAQSFVEVIQDGRLLTHTWTTLVAVVFGLIAGVSIALALGYAIARINLLEDLLSPLIVGLQSTPVVAYAPLLVIWFGSGVTGKVITSALIVFFPMLMNTIVGIRNVPENLRDLMRVSQATPWQTFTRLELPAAMPVLLTGLKTSATLAVVGAVVGEFVNADAGLGFMIGLAQRQFDTAEVFVGVITLAILARLLYGLVGTLENRLLAWQDV